MKPLPTLNTLQTVASTKCQLRAKCAALTSNCWALNAPKKMTLVITVEIPALFSSSTVYTDGFQSTTITQINCPMICQLTSRTILKPKQLKT